MLFMSWQKKKKREDTAYNYVNYRIKMTYN